MTTSHLDAIDIQNALLLGHKLEIDDVSQGPQSIVAQQHGQQLFLDSWQDRLGTPLQAMPHCFSRHINVPGQVQLCLTSNT